MNSKLRSVTTAMLLAAAVCGCYVPAASGPQQLDVDAGEDSTIQPGAMATLEASVRGKTTGYAFRWSHEYGPELVQILDETSPSTKAGPLKLEGEYKFRVVASTAAGEFGHGFLVVTVAIDAGDNDNENDQDNVNANEDADDNQNDNQTTEDNENEADSDELIPPDRVRMNAPSNLAIGERGDLVASEAPLGFEASYTWTVLAGSATIRDPSARQTTITGTETGTVEVEVTMTVAGIEEEFTDVTVIEIIPEGIFAANIAGPIDAVVGQEVKLNVGYFGIVPGDRVASEWEIVEGEGELIESSMNEAIIASNTEGEVVVLVKSYRTTGQTATSGDLHRILVHPDTSLDLEAELLEHLSLVGQPVSVDVAAPDGENDALDFSWRFVRGQGSFDNPGARTPNVTVTSLGTAELEVTATRIIDRRMHSGTLTTFVTTVNDLQTEVVIDVKEFGLIPIELDGEAAPIAVANFLHYVDAPEYNYDNHVFNRVIPGFVIQAGSWWFGGSGIVEVETRPPIPGEADNGLSNVRGTVAMALLGADVDSATQAFYINLVDNLYLDEDFTVFGQVTGNGMNVADAISMVETDASDAPVDFVIIDTISRTDTEGGG